MQSRQNSSVKEAIFGTQPITRLTLYMVANKFRVSKNSNPFLYNKYDLKRIEIIRSNGLPIAGTPIDTERKVCIYHNSLPQLCFKNGGNKNSLDFVNKFIVTFDLISSQEASKKLTIFLELTRAPINLKLLFPEALREAVELD